MKKSFLHLLENELMSLRNQTGKLFSGAAHHQVAAKNFPAKPPPQPINPFFVSSTPSVSEPQFKCVDFIVFYLHVSFL